jgi:RNA polymerase sigma-70 factor, ECF subfamily
MLTSTRTPLDTGGPCPRALVARTQAGDADAFAALYEHYRKTIYEFVLRRVSNPTVAEDLTSEVFIRALRGIGRFTWQGRDPIHWFITIAANLTRDHFGAVQRRPEVVSNEAVLCQERRETCRQYRAVQGQPERAALDQVTGEALRDAIGQLGEAQRECIQLRSTPGCRRRRSRRGWAPLTGPWSACSTGRCGP